MRRPRAILYDDDRTVLDLLALYFGERGYEVIACRAPVACPVYGEGARCDKLHPCGDIMTVDLMMPGMTGLELLELQVARGCKLDAKNKAIVSGSLDSRALAAIRRLGCAAFAKPFRLARLEEWIRECEPRMDLSRPLGIKRREPRESCGTVGVVVGPEGQTWSAEILNRSESGRCLRLDGEPGPVEVIELRCVEPGVSGRLRVRWTQPEGARGFLVGTSSC